MRSLSAQRDQQCPLKWMLVHVCIVLVVWASDSGAEDCRYNHWVGIAGREEGGQCRRTGRNSQRLATDS